MKPEALLNQLGCKWISALSKPEAAGCAASPGRKETKAGTAHAWGPGENEEDPQHVTDHEAGVRPSQTGALSGIPS